MANHFVDLVNGSDVNSGHDMDNAWATLSYALVSGGLIAGDICWVRRNGSEVLASSPIPAASGDIDTPIKYIGWPRNTFSIPNADWTNGSNLISNVVPLIRPRAHMARFVTAPNGKDYLITKISGGTIEDAFTGTSGPPDSGKWDLTYAGGVFSISSNKLAFFADTTPTPTYKITSWAKVSGDFDIQIDFDSYVDNSDQGNYAGIYLTNRILGVTYQILVRCDRNGTGPTFLSNDETNDVWGTASEVARTNDYGGLRIKRTGTTVTAQYKDGAGAWTNIHTKDQLVAPDFHVKIVVYRNTSNISGNFDALTLNSGTVVNGPTNSFTIDREYSGPSVTGTSGAVTIKADEDYSLAQAIDDSTWTIKKTDWNGEGDDLASLQGEAASAYRLYNDTKNYIHYKNIHLIGGTTPSITFDIRRSFGVIFRGCLLESKSNATCVRFNEENHLIFDRGIILGANAGTSERGMQLLQSYLKLIDVALYGFGDWGIYGADAAYELVLENVNIGVEVANGDDDMSLIHLPNVKAKDVKFGGTNGEILINTFPGRVAVENYNKVLAAHRVFLAAGYFQKTLANGAGDVPNQRDQGSADVVEVVFNQAGHANPIKEIAPLIFEHEYETDNVSRSYRYHIQAMGAVAAAELWLEAEYVDSYDDETEYTTAKVESDESIAARVTQSDWTNYIEVTGIEPAVASKVRIKCFCSYYHATNKIFIDPKVSIT